MLAIRLNTALGLLLTGVLLTATALVLLSHPLLTHSGLVGTLLTSDANHRGAEGTGAAGCHEESAPTKPASSPTVDHLALRFLFASNWSFHC